MEVRWLFTVPSLRNSSLEIWAVGSSLHQEDEDLSLSARELSVGAHPQRP